MAFGLVVYDLLFVALATALYGVAVSAGLATFTALGAGSFALVPSVLITLLALVAQVGVLSFFCPRLEPGRYPLMKGRVFWGWLLRHMLRRLLMVPGVKWTLFSSNVLRYFALRAMGARVAFTANMSSDVDVLDPALLEVGAGATLGARCLITGHYIDRGLLVLGRVVIKPGALLAAEVSVSPGCVIGNKAVLKPRAGLGPDVIIEDEAQVGSTTLIDSGAHLGVRAYIGNRAYLRARVVIGEAGRVPAGATVERPADGISGERRIPDTGDNPRENSGT